MPFADVGDARLHYEDRGTGYPVLLIAPGGMLSSLDRWEGAPWNPIESLQDSFRVIAMDQRNAGSSVAPVRQGDGWARYTSDQLGLMDALGIDRFHVLGMCIGGPFSMGLIEAAPDRVTSAVVLQPIGEAGNRAAFYELFDRWKQGLGDRVSQIEEGVWDAFRESMFGGDFLFNVGREFVASVTTPLLVLMGDDLYHPAAISREVVELARHAELIEHWKDADAVSAGRARVKAFLREHTPSD